MKVNDAVDWHSEKARQFDSKYAHDRSFMERETIWTDMIRRHSSKSSIVIDIGCGSGVLSLFAAERNRKVYGIDGSPEMIGLCEKRRFEKGIDNAIFINCLLDGISERREEIEDADMVICSSVLEYVDDLNSALDTISSLVKPGGVFMVSLPNGSSLFRKVEPFLYRLTGRPGYYRYIKNVFTAEEFNRRLEQRGYKVIERRYYGQTPVLSPLMRATNLRKYSENLFVAICRKNVFVSLGNMDS